MNREEFYYELPSQLIAQEPLAKREEAKLMVVERKTKTIHHDIFLNIDQYLPKRSMLVINDSKVIPARLFGRRKTGGRVEIFLLKRLADGYSYEALLRPLKRLKEKERIVFNGGRIFAEIKDKERHIVSFNRKNINRYLSQIGHVPLPPYIKREDRPLDHRYYQTVYARHPGSVAAPTAGLHITKVLINKLQNQGHAIKRVTLHINYATFKLVEENDIAQHKMHKEEYKTSKTVFDTICKAKKEGRKIVAVGTTSCRVLESVQQSRVLKGETDLFIYPGFQFQMVDILVTNFHLPFSTLLMLIYAFGGIDLMRKAYQEAIEGRYRFFSYGDAMLIL